MSGDLNGKRILIVEDSPLIAAVLEDMLQDLGCIVAGPTGSMAYAMEMAEKEPLDAAVIDINIRGGKVFPVAETLTARNIPFLLASGYADWTLPEHLRERPRLVKPYSAEVVERQLLKLLDGSAAVADTPS